MPNQLHTSTWVIVADNSQVKIYRVVKFPKLEELTSLEHPESRLHNQDLVSSKPGHNFQRGGTSGYSYEPERGPKKLEAEKFAAHLGQYLANAEKNKEFSRLYIIAEPSFLGLLRPHINHATQNTIIAEVSKGLTSADTAAIEKQISEI